MVDWNLTQHYEKFNLTRDESFMLIQILSYNKNPVSDSRLGLKKTKACELRKSLVEKGFIKSYVTIPGKGTIYNLDVSKWANDCVKAKEKNVEKVEERKEAPVKREYTDNERKLIRLYNYFKERNEVYIFEYVGDYSIPTYFPDKKLYDFEGPYLTHIYKATINKADINYKILDYVRKELFGG